MNIHQILSEGQGIQLGPIKVSKTYPFKPGDKNRFVLIEDSSGKGALKIWGAAANSDLQPGMVLTLVGTGPRGGVKTSEYNGKTSIDANDCRIEFAGGAPASDGHSGTTEHVGYSPPASAYQPPAATGSDKLPQVMKRCALATRLYIDELTINHGFSKDEAMMLAQNAPAWYPLMWFGEKGLG